MKSLIYLCAAVLQPIVSISGLSYAYDTANPHPILNAINLDIYAGQLVIITGPSGSGKTTLLTIMGSLRTASQGSVRVLGHSLTGTTPGEKSSKKSIVPAKISMELRQKIGFIFQNHNLLKALSSQDNVGLPLERDGLTGIERNQKAQIILKRLGLGNHLNAYPAQLSGGQRQRVAIARALVRKPALVLADEPTASLDFTSALEVMACLKEAASSWGTTTIMVTHDQRLMHHVDRVIHMEDGTIITQNNQAAVA